MDAVKRGPRIIKTHPPLLWPQQQAKAGHRADKRVDEHPKQKQQKNTGKIQNVGTSRSGRRACGLRPARAPPQKQRLSRRVSGALLRRQSHGRACTAVRAPACITSFTMHHAQYQWQANWRSSQTPRPACIKCRGCLPSGRLMGKKTGVGAQRSWEEVAISASTARGYDGPGTRHE